MKFLEELSSCELLFLCLALFFQLADVGLSADTQETSYLKLDDDLGLPGRDFSPAHLLNPASSGPGRVLERHKRQSMLSCPSRPASGRETGLTYALLYSPNTRQDVKIAYGGPNGGWRSGEMQKLANNGFNASQPSLIYVHAYTQSARSGWLRSMRQLYDQEFPKQDVDKPTTFNLLFFDWSSYSRQAYATSVSWVPHLGKVLGDFLNQLAERFSYNLSEVHLISYSLSTHIAGNAGRRVRKLGQITALDPTGVCLHHDNGFARKYALKPSDAKLVVARHYDMQGLGAKRAIGGVDIYVNGGRNQPGAGYGRWRRAADEPASMQVSQSSSMGSHARAAEHESQAEDGRCYEVAYACRSYAAFLAGECGSCGSRGNKCYYLNNFKTLQFEQKGVQVRAENGYKTRTRMYLRTSGSSNFCLHHYQLLVKLKANTPSGVRDSLKSGQVALQLEGDDSEVLLKHRASHNKYTALVLRNKRLSKADRIRVRLGSSSKIDLKELGSAVKRIELNYMSHAVSSERQRLSASYCLDANETAFMQCSLDGS